MSSLRMIHLIQPIHSWHDAMICAFILVVLYLLRVLLVLAKRIASVSLEKREVRFIPK